MSQHYSKAPIAEAVISLQIEPAKGVDLARFRQLADALPAYPTRLPIKTIQMGVAAAGTTGWAAPHITASEAGEVVFEWWHGSRKLTLYISDARVEYIKVGGPDIDNEMETGAVFSERDFIPLWGWLYA